MKRFHIKLNSAIYTILKSTEQSRLQHIGVCWAVIVILILPVCKEERKLTHVSLILKGVIACTPHAVEMGGALAAEAASGLATVFGGPEPLEALLHDG